ncbi:hypothetical protein [Nocardia sp. NPDC057227]|uniref:hypothetical protein n=1 Tax=Nocardia sp. NPDC057227 TaxID=3346056 RepID=UPI003634655B
MSDLLHRCRQGKRCKSRTRTPANEWLACGVERPDSLCRACEESAFDAIRELDSDMGSLEAAWHEIKATVSGPKVSGSSELPIPIPLGVDALLREIDAEVTRWAIRATGGEELRNAHSMLCANLGTLVDLPPQRVTVWQPHPDGGDDPGDLVLDGVDAVLRLARFHGRAQAMLGLTEVTTLLPDPCPHCGRKALAVSKDQERVMCQGCRICWDSAHFALLSNVLDYERREVRAVA